MNKVKSVKEAMLLAETHLQEESIPHMIIFAGPRIDGDVDEETKPYHWTVIFVPIDENDNVDLNDSNAIEVKVFPNGNIETASWEQ